MSPQAGWRAWVACCLVKRPRPAALLVALGTAGVLALTGCGSGRYNQNFEQRAPVGGADLLLGDLELRNAYILSPAKVGGDALVVFSLFGRAGAAPEQLTGVTLPSVSDAPLQLLQIEDGRQVPVPGIEVDAAQTTGERLYAASARRLKADLPPATYHDAVFDFSAHGPLTLRVPVRTIGQVQPGSTVLPSGFPDEPFPARDGLPGGLSTAAPESGTEGG